MQYNHVELIQYLDNYFVRRFLFHITLYTSFFIWLSVNSSISIRPVFYCMVNTLSLP